MPAKSGFLHGCWEEVVGELFSLEKNDQWLTVKLTITLVFPVKGLEAKIIEKKLRGVEAGKVVSILRTDLVEKPIVVRMPKEEEMARGASHSTGGR